MAGYSPASVATAARYMGTDYPNTTHPEDYAKQAYLQQNAANYMLCEAPTPETLAGNVKEILKQVDYLTGLVDTVESVLFGADHPLDTGAIQGLAKDPYVPTVGQNISSVQSRLYNLGATIENINRKLGGR